jgi:two-component system phosphate regulon sensor histidine kinase PhoR
MKRVLLVSLVVAITVSLIGLIVIQLSWISKSAAIEEDSFGRRVYEAAERAIEGYYSFEIDRLASFRDKRASRIIEMMAALDSLHQEYKKALPKQVDQNQHLEGQNQPAVFFNQSIREWRNGQEVLSSDSLFVSGKNGAFGPDNVPISVENHQLEEHQKIFMERLQLNEEFNQELRLLEKSLELSPAEEIRVLDSLLFGELRNSGINTQYDFAVYDNFYNRIILEKTDQNTKELMQSDYQYMLSPNLYPFRTLSLYFPHKSNYLFSQTYGVLIISLLFILIIISSFAYTFYNIIRQKKLSVMKNDFINNMTHELKTPISTISLVCQALNDKDIVKSEDLYQSYIKMVDQENKRLGMMTERVLQTAIIDKGRLKLSKIGLDIHELILEAIEKTNIQVKAKKGTIFDNLEAEYSFILADKVHLTNVLVNLLDNANKYTPENPVIKVSTENNGKGVLVHVQDNGIGISKANHKKVFERLFRVSTGNRHDVKGFGLGLSYVKAIVEQHGGTINLESEIGKGSRFTIFIPFGFKEFQDFKNN